jgi:hypothetical protein
MLEAGQHSGVVTNWASRDADMTDGMPGRPLAYMLRHVLSVAGALVKSVEHHHRRMVE